MTTTKSPVSTWVVKMGLCLPRRTTGRFFRDPAHDLVGRVDHIPLTFDLFGLGAESFHREPDIKAASGRACQKFLLTIYRAIVRLNSPGATLE